MSEKTINLRQQEALTRIGNWLELANEESGELRLFESRK
jgi:hypothetical protein